MRCKKFKFCMERYYDRVLPARLQSACDEHLRNCPECRNAFADIDTIKSFFLDASPSAAPGDLAADIMRNIRISAAGGKNQNVKTLVQWWKEAAIPVRLAVSVTLFVIITASFFAGRDLWSPSAIKTFPEYSEFDTFSESQKGSLETAYLQLLQTSSQGLKQ